MKEMHERVDKIRKPGAETGCSILNDGWKDANGRRLADDLDDCPKGTVYLSSSVTTNGVEKWMQHSCASPKFWQKSEFILDITHVKPF